MRGTGHFLTLGAFWLCVQHGAGLVLGMGFTPCFDIVSLAGGICWAFGPLSEGFVGTPGLWVPFLDPGFDPCPLKIKGPPQ